MTTTDKILLGLSCHARSDCGGCPYEDQPECSSKLAADAEKLLIAAVDDLKDRCYTGRSMCYYCKYYYDEHFCESIECDDGDAFEWRGVEVE